MHGAWRERIKSEAGFLGIKVPETGLEPALPLRCAFTSLSEHYCGLLAENVDNCVFLSPITGHSCCTFRGLIRPVLAENWRKRDPLGSYANLGIFSRAPQGVAR